MKAEKHKEDPAGLAAAVRVAYAQEIRKAERAAAEAMRRRCVEDAESLAAIYQAQAEAAKPSGPWEDSRQGGKAIAVASVATSLLRLPLEAPDATE